MVEQTMNTSILLGLNFEREKFERMDPAQLLASQNRSFPSLEYVLQGSIEDQSVDFLKARLQGLCDNITGQFVV